MKQKINLRLFCAVFLLLDLLLAAVLAGSILGSSAKPERERDAREGSLYGSDMADELPEEFKRAQAAAAAAAKVTIDSEVTLTEGEIPIYLSNADDNDCSVSIEIVLMETGQRIASSGSVEPGWRLERLPAETKLDSGSHMCLVRCAFYTTQGNAFLGTAVKQLLLTVE